MSYDVVSLGFGGAAGGGLGSLILQAGTPGPVIVVLTTALLSAIVGGLGAALFGVVANAIVRWSV